MKLVILDGYTENPGDLSWDGLRELAEVTVYDRTSLTDPAQTIARLPLIPRSIFPSVFRSWSAQETPGTGGKAMRHAPLTQAAAVALPTTGLLRPCRSAFRRW